MDNPKAWARDAVERIVSTLLQVVVAAALAAFTQAITGAENVTLDTVTGALVAAYAAGLAALKAWLAKLIPDTVSPASVVKSG